MNSIKLGDGALWGRNDSSCSLKMENLSDLISITSNGNSFQYYRSVTLSNIPYLETVNLPNSFQSVYFKSITNVTPILASLFKNKSGIYILLCDKRLSFLIDIVVVRSCLQTNLFLCFDLSYNIPLLLKVILSEMLY